MKEKINKVNIYLENCLEQGVKHTSVDRLRKSMSYSLNGGGKRFRPLLSLLVTEMLSGDEEKVLPFAAAVEMVHTYSLIHDDLPCMDDDDERRGRPTNHKVFGEDVALVAGDALLTESFALIAKNYPSELVGKLVKALVQASGKEGMIGGQAIDLSVQKGSGADLNLEELLLMHKLKTGALIRTAAEGAGIICGVKDEELDKIITFAETLGLCFQIADDILDVDEEDQERGSFITILGLEGTKKKLEELSKQALSALEIWGDKAKPLQDLVVFNRDREV